MKLILGDTEFKHFEDVNVSLNYDAIASAFSFNVLFDPNIQAHRELFRPDQYLDAKVIDDNGKLLIAGYLLSSNFRSSSTKSMTKISGYTYTGALEDSNIPTSLYPLQVRGLSLYEICRKICDEFGIEVVMDMDVAARAMKPFDKALSRDTNDIKSFICELARNRQLLITHTNEGSLLITESKAETEPLVFFEKGMPGVEFDFNFNGQKMHSTIEVQRQQSKSNKSKGVGKIENPYSSKRFRPSVKRQSSGDNMEDVNTTVRNALSDELKGIELTIRINDWYVGSNHKVILTPNNIISVMNPELGIYKPTNFLIENVSISGNSAQKVSTLKCYLPEVYNTNPVKNIFD